MPTFTRANGSPMTLAQAVVASDYEEKSAFAHALLTGQLGNGHPSELIADAMDHLATETAQREQKRKFDQEQRDRAADQGHALPDGSFPIKNRDDLKNAISAYGRAKDKDAAKKHIIKRAKELGASWMLPDDWTSEGKARAARGFRAAAAAADRLFTAAWDPTAHPRDENGRFIDTPDVQLSNGAHARAIRQVGDAMAVQLDSGTMVNVNARDVRSPESPSTPKTPSVGDGATADPRDPKGELTSVPDPLGGDGTDAADYTIPPDPRKGAAGRMEVGERVTTEFGPGEVTDSSERRVVIKLDDGDTINVANGTPGYGRIKRDGGAKERTPARGVSQEFSGRQGLTEARRKVRDDIIEANGGERGARGYNIRSGTMVLDKEINGTWVAYSDGEATDMVEGVQADPKGKFRVRAANVSMEDANAGGDEDLTRNDGRAEAAERADEPATKPDAPKKPKAKPGDHFVTHPDGTISKRNSKTRDYTHAVVFEQDNRKHAAYLRKQADRDRARAAEVRKAADGPITEERSSGGSTTMYVGGEYAGWVAPGADRPSDEDLRAKVRADADDHDANALAKDQEIEELENGPETSYNVVRWSGSADNALKAKNSNDWADMRRYGRMVVVEVDPPEGGEDRTPDRTPDKVAPDVTPDTDAPDTDAPDGGERDLSKMTLDEIAKAAGEALIAGDMDTLTALQAEVTARKNRAAAKPSPDVTPDVTPDRGRGDSDAWDVTSMTEADARRKLAAQGYDEAEIDDIVEDFRRDKEAIEIAPDGTLDRLAVRADRLKEGDEVILDDGTLDTVSSVQRFDDGRVEVSFEGMDPNDPPETYRARQDVDVAWDATKSRDPRVAALGKKGTPDAEPETDPAMAELAKLSDEELAASLTAARRIPNFPGLALLEAEQARRQGNAPGGGTAPERTGGFRAADLDDEQLLGQYRDLQSRDGNGDTLTREQRRTLRDLGEEIDRRDLSRDGDGGDPNVATITRAILDTSGAVTVGNVRPDTRAEGLPEGVTLYRAVVTSRGRETPMWIGVDHEGGTFMNAVPDRRRALNEIADLDRMGRINKPDNTSPDLPDVHGARGLVGKDVRVDLTRSPNPVFGKVEGVDDDGTIRLRTAQGSLLTLAPDRVKGVSEGTPRADQGSPRAVGSRVSVMGTSYALDSSGRSVLRNERVDGTVVRAEQVDGSDGMWDLTVRTDDGSVEVVRTKWGERGRANGVQDPAMSTPPPSGERLPDGSRVNVQLGGNENDPPRAATLVGYDENGLARITFPGAGMGNEEQLFPPHLVSSARRDVPVNPDVAVPEGTSKKRPGDLQPGDVVRLGPTGSVVRTVESVEDNGDDTFEVKFVEEDESLPFGMNVELDVDDRAPDSGTPDGDAPDYSSILTPDVDDELRAAVRAAKAEGNDSTRIDADGIVARWGDTLTPAQYRNLDTDKADEVLYARLREIEAEEGLGSPGRGGATNRGGTGSTGGTAPTRGVRRESKPRALRDDGKGDGAKAQAEVPTVEQIMADQGLDEDAAKKEWRRQYNAARFRIRRARLKAEKDQAKAETIEPAERVMKAATPSVSKLRADSVDAALGDLERRNVAETFEQARSNLLEIEEPIRDPGSNGVLADSVIPNAQPLVDRLRNALGTDEDRRKTIELFRGDIDHVNKSSRMEGEQKARALAKLEGSIKLIEGDVEGLRPYLDIIEQDANRRAFDGFAIGVMDAKVVPELGDTSEADAIQRIANAVRADTDKHALASLQELVRTLENGVIPLYASGNWGPQRVELPQPRKGGGVLDLPPDAPMEDKIARLRETLDTGDALFRRQQFDGVRQTWVKDRAPDRGPTGEQLETLDTLKVMGDIIATEADTLLRERAKAEGIDIDAIEKSAAEAKDEGAKLREEILSLGKSMPRSRDAQQSFMLRAKVDYIEEHWGVPNGYPRQDRTVGYSHSPAYGAFLKEHRAAQEAIRIQGATAAMRDKARELEGILGKAEAHSSTELMRNLNDYNGKVMKLRDLEAGGDAAATNAKLARIRGEVYRDTLARVRGVGETSDVKMNFVGGSASAKRALSWASSFYPTDWVDKARRVPVTIGRGQRRGHYNPGSRTIVLSKRGGKTSIEGDKDTNYGVAIHELGHHMESMVPGLADAQWAFLWQRTSEGPPENRLRERQSHIAGAGRSEYGYKDDFSSHYSGKTYGRGLSDVDAEENYELFTTGIESLFAGSDYMDDDYRRWILGVLAHL